MEASKETTAAEEAGQDCEHPFQEASDLSDVTLIVGQHKLYVNKTLLALHSPVFHKMFFSEFLEKNSTEVHLPGKNFQDVVNFLRQLYPVHSFAKITDETLAGVLTLADEYMVEHVRQKCQQYIRKKLPSSTALTDKGLTVDQVLLYLLLADRCRFTDLKETLIKEAEKRCPEQLFKSSFYEEVDLKLMRDLLLKKVLVKSCFCASYEKQGYELIRREADISAQEGRMREVRNAKERLENENRQLMTQLQYARHRHVTLKDYLVSFRKRYCLWRICLYLILASCVMYAVIVNGFKLSSMLKRCTWPSI